MKKLLLLLICPLLAWGQVTVVQSPVPKFRSFLPSGAPNVGGCVYTFASGTSTPQATYTDFTGSTTNSNPVILDGNGEAPIWITNATYRFQVWSFGSGTIGSNCGNGAQIYQIDGIRDTGLSPTSNPLAISAITNGIDIASITRATDISPSGNFLNLKSQAGASLFKIDINGNVNASNGTAAAPTYTFASDTATGMYLQGSRVLGFTSNGNNQCLLGLSFMRCGSSQTFGFSSAADPAGGASDVVISRVSAGVMGVGTSEASGAVGGEIRSARISATYNAAGTVQTAVHLVQDTCTLGTNCAITLTGTAVYTSATSYTCTCHDQTTPLNACGVNQTAGGALTITGTGTDVIRFMCVGN